MNSLVSVLHAVRSRLELPGRVSDAQILELALADGLFGSGEVHNFMQSRQLLSDLERTKARRFKTTHRGAAVQHELSQNSRCTAVALSLAEWQMLYAARGAQPTAEPATVLDSREGREVMSAVEAALLFTLRESDQARRWKQPLVRMLVLLALCTEDSSVERATSVLGAVVLTDHRKIDDFRARLESAGPSVLLLSSAVSFVVASLGVGHS
jgi:hypothetical protein